jgi:hypothetical protein
MSEPKLTFDQALQNKDLIDSMYYSLQGLGENNLEYDPETILNTFLTKKRYGDVNIFSTVGQLQDVKGMDQNTKNMFAYALQETEKLPSIFSSGSAGTASAIGDYLLAGLTDPTNLLSAVAGAFTLGSGGAAILGAKEAAKAGIGQLLKAKARAAISKPVLKSLAVEGTVAGVGGGTQAKLKQDIEQEVGLRKQGDYDIEDIALQGILEGTISPIAGIVGNITGSLAKEGVKGGARTVASIFGDTSSIDAAAAMTKKYFLPTAGIDDVTRRLSERRIGQVSSVKEQAQELGEQFSTLSQRVLGDLPEQDRVKLLNDLLENKAEARQAVAARSPELIQTVDDFYALKDQAYTLGKQSLLSEKTKGIFEKDNANYIRNVAEGYTAVKRKSFNKFLKQNDNILNEYKDDIIQNVRTASEIGDRAAQDALDSGMTMRQATAAGRKAESEAINPAYFGVAQKFMSRNDQTGQWDILLPDEQVNKIIRQEAKKLYTPSVIKKQETGAFKQRQEVPEVVKKLIGYNNRPALRIAETINGIVDTASKTSLAGDIVADASRLNIGGVFKDQATASSSLGTDVVRLVGSKESPFNLPEQYIDDTLKNSWVSKEYAGQLKELFDDTPFAAGTIEKFGGDLLGPVLANGYRNILAGQNFAKAGKTIYSPIAHVRNAIGAVGYTWASGNPLGIASAVKTWKFSPKDQKAALWKEFEDLGLKGSNIDLNQVLRRFGDITSASDPSNAWQSALYLGKPGKIARKWYQGTDDLGKFSVYLNEKRVSNNVFDKLTPDQQQAKLARFAEEYQIDPAVVTKEDYIKEVAAKNTANITPLYGRISPIFERLRTVPVIGSFVAYPAERLRNTYNILKIGTDELREGFELGNKTLQRQGMARLANWYAAQGSMYAGAYAVNEYTGLADNLEEIRSAFLPDFKKDNALLITGKNQYGLPKFIDLSYIHPDSNFLGAIVPMMLKASRGEDVSKDLDKQLLESGTRLLEPYVSKSLVFDAAESLKNFAETGDVSTLGGAVKALEPGYIKIVRDMAMDAGAFEKFGSTGYDIETFFEPRRFGEVVERGMQGTGSTKEIASFLDMNEDFADVLAKNSLVYPGMREESIDPRKAIGFALNNLKRNNKENWNYFSKDLTNKLIDPSGQFNVVSILKEYSKQLDSQFESQKGLSKLLTDMEAVIPRTELFKVLKSKSLRGVTPSSKDLKSFITNKSTPIILSNNNNFWSDINKDLALKTGREYGAELSQLRDYFREVEKYYMFRDLSKDLPGIEIEEE